MAWDLRNVSSLGDEKYHSWTSSIQNEDDKHGLLANTTEEIEEHDNSGEIAWNSKGERSKLNFSYALRKAFSHEPDADNKEAQPLSHQFKKPQILYQDEQAEQIEVDGRVLATSVAVGKGEATLDGAYNIRKAKSCPISTKHEEHKKKRGMFGKMQVKRGFVTKSYSKSLRKGGKKTQKNASFDDESTQCITAANSWPWPDSPFFMEEEHQGKSKKRRCDPWVVTLIIFICMMLGIGGFAAVYFLPGMLAKEENGQSGEKAKKDFIEEKEKGNGSYEDIVDIVYTPTNISVSLPPIGESTSVTFYAMADAPYTDHERENIMPYQIKNLSSSADFLIHLGDLQYAGDGCQEYGYKAASDILKMSSIPVFAVPGDNDINDCDDFEHGEEQWKKHFHLLDENWEHDFEVSRWGKLDESFAFFKNRVLFFGLNIVGGSPHFSHEWKRRHAEHLHRVKELMTKLEDIYDVAVLLAHASPGSNHDDFFVGEDGLASFVKQTGKPFLHLHGDDHVYLETEGAFDVDNYMMVSLECGETARPIKVEIDTRKENPIKVSREDDNLEVKCCSEGWPMADEL